MSSVRIRYRTYDFGDVDIHVRSLRDTQQFSDDGGEAAALGISSAMWPIFGVVWESGQVLARMMAVEDVADRRVLEVGCGLGLASLVLNDRGADITATDRHPEAEEFLAHNVALNHGERIPFLRTDWLDEDTELGLFSLIIGSDLLYERAPVDALVGFLERHAEPTCEIIVIDPGRGHRGFFARRMVELGFERQGEVAGSVENQAQVLRFTRSGP